MKVSVIIPTYNRPNKLLRAVTSLTNQTQQPDEVIIVNDGSSLSYKECFSKLKEIENQSELNISYSKFKKNRGACHGRNYGAKKATGDILMFLDDDDRWLENKIEYQVKQLSDADLTYCSRRVVDEKGEFQHYSYADIPSNPRREILINNFIGTTICVALRSEIFEAAGGFDPEMPAKQDHELWIRVLDHCDRIVVGTEPVVEYTIHTDGTKQISGQPEQVKEAICKLLNNHKDRFSELTWIEMRRAQAGHHARLAVTYVNAGGAKNMQRYHAIKSIQYFPTTSGMFRLVPENYRPIIRRYYQNIRSR